MQTWWSIPTHYTALPSPVAHSLTNLPSYWSYCFSFWAQLSGRTWTLHIGWSITKEQERNSGPANSQGFTNRHISLPLPEKCGLQFCLNARDVFHHGAEDWANSAGFCLGGRYFNGHRGPIKLWGLRNQLWLILSFATAASSVNVRSTRTITYMFKFWFCMKWRGWGEPKWS